MTGPLAGFRILEFAGIGPAPMAAMLLADLGATVLRLDRTEPSGLGFELPEKYQLLNRSRPSLAIDLKKPEGVALALDLVGAADALIEGFRPGTMERLGLGPDVCLQRNPGLVYGRMTGWGQDGPLASAAGHDLNYIALVGALHSIGRAGQPPTPPLNLVGDFGGGALYLAMGVLAGLLERTRSGAGQVVDAAMTDGAASLMTAFFGFAAAGVTTAPRGENILDSGAPYYDVYECADGQYVALAPIEGKFRRELYRLIELDEAALPDAAEPTNWPAIKDAIAARITTRTREQWCRLLEGSDACFAPVLSLAEAPGHPHNRARGTFVEVGGVVQPAPAPRFSRTPSAKPTPPQPRGSASHPDLAGWGLSAARAFDLQSRGVIATRG
ncbi:MAG: CoA transferase [Alphaproteobacteria bacterium]|nr:CoA transferase [Alphaproteobacteria bacterium]